MVPHVTTTFAGPVDPAGIVTTIVVPPAPTLCTAAWLAPMETVQPEAKPVPVSVAVPVGALAGALSGEMAVTVSGFT